MASADIAVMGRVQDIRRERIGVIDRQGGVKRGIVCKIDGRGDDVRPMEVVGGWCRDTGASTTEGTLSPPFLSAKREAGLLWLSS